MTATTALTADLQKQVRALVDDLRKRVDENPELHSQWQDEHRRANEKERTAASWVEWRDDRLDQAAVAWVLTTVFIRFCEDNALVKPVWITGPGRRRQEALDAQREFFQKHPKGTDREWLWDAIEYLGSLPATKALVDTHSALRWVSPSGDEVTELLKFWRNRTDDGTLVHDLHDETLSTRFLGDLYQELSAYAKDKYALLQTPVFVEEFILDRTLSPALDEHPLEGFRMIDPTCGSGHFLLGSFDRLLDRWHKQAPNLEIQAKIQSALDAIHGVDLNPFAVAIARFRLTIAALNASGLRLLEDAPAFKYHLAVGDSLIHGPDSNVLPGMEDRSAYMPFHYATEDAQLLLGILEEGRYDVVVGNPPYIQPKDKALNQAYRSKFGKICKGKYALTAPFIVQFFTLAKKGDDAGCVGVIASNSFMKREFGVNLIEQFLSHVDLQLIIDSEGAWIPGHNADGTPTVIFTGRNRLPVKATVLSVLGKTRRETREHGNEGKGPYWSAIVDHWNDAGWDDDWITVSELDRSYLAKHPWSLSGGSAGNVRQLIESAPRKLAERSYRVGFMAISAADEVFIVPIQYIARNGLSPRIWPSVVSGSSVRNFFIESGEVIYFPYENKESLIPVRPGTAEFRHLWPMRTILENRAAFNGGTYRSNSVPWNSWHQLPVDKKASPLSIAYAEVASHNHFVLDRGGRIFKQTAPIVKLPRGATEDEHIALIGILNSSAACFWFKQQAQPKGGAADRTWLRTYQVNSTIVQELPLPANLPEIQARRLDALAQKISRYDPSKSFQEAAPTLERINGTYEHMQETRSLMIAVQEELDWEVYRLYGLIDEDLTYDGDLPSIRLGERAFEIAIVANGGSEDSWFVEQNIAPASNVPEHWPSDYQFLVQQRLRKIAESPYIQLLERPEYKRRWENEAREKWQRRTLKSWLLDRLEDRRFWFNASGSAVAKSVVQLADEVTRDTDMVSVLALWEERPDVPVTDSLLRLLEDEAVPFLAAYRYKDSGLRKRDAWEKTWHLQRREDGGESVGPIPTPPTYKSADFLKPSYARARGALDVPKERFILYPDASRGGDTTPLLGWAGWDHAQRALALAAIIQEREQEGWEDEPLSPLVAGLAELEPWIDQWHTEMIPEYTASYATICRQELDERAAQVGKTRQELAAWRPAAVTRGRKKATKG